MGFLTRRGAGQLACYGLAGIMCAWPVLADPASQPTLEQSVLPSSPTAAPVAEASPSQPGQGAQPTTATEAAPTEAPPQLAEPARAEAEPERLGTLVRTRIDKVMRRLDPAGADDAKALKAFMEARKDEPLWIEGDTLGERAKSVMAELAKAGEWGLDPAAFNIPETGGNLDREQAADVEMSLSLAVLTYARHARGGRITDPARQLSSYLDRKPQLLDPKAVLETVAAAPQPDAALRGFHPKHPQFLKLRQRYLELIDASRRAEEEIVKIPPGPALSPGDKQASVPLLRKRLKLTVAEGGDETLYDEALVTAVKAFQTEKGLRPDGIVGAMTRSALNDIDLPSPQKILANMEQWRWMPDDLGAYYIWVNIPEFQVRVVRDGAIVHEERVITGLPDKQTPVFSAEMELVTLNPSWNVPNSIKVNELYPSLARGGSYFEKQGLTLKQNGKLIDPADVNWSSADIRKFDVQQPPGATNVLGVVKLSFPNKHIVYMHDTPTKNLFNAASRTFSHGCIRVRDPMRLAEVVLAADKGWDAQKIGSMRGDGRVETPIPLGKKVPVHLTYFTSWIGEDGSEQRFKDVYGHEKRLMLALEGRFAEIDIGPDHLAPVPAPKLQYASDGDALQNFFDNLFGGF